MNVNLLMSVELGRTELPFKKVLELTRGSIISLDKLAGEPVELFAIPNFAFKLATSRAVACCCVTSAVCTDIGKSIIKSFVIS